MLFLCSENVCTRTAKYIHFMYIYYKIIQGYDCHHRLHWVDMKLVGNLPYNNHDLYKTPFILKIHAWGRQICIRLAINTRK